MTLTEYKKTLPEGAKLIPILFSTPMVQAIMDGRKTQTRRVCKHQHWSHSELVDVNVNGITQKVDRNVSCPYGKPGDILWVRETHWAFGEWEPNGKTKTGKQKWEFKRHLDADIQFNEPGTVMPNSYRKPAWYKRHSLFMPLEACRTFLKVKSVRVERLHDISEEDSKSEGVEDGLMPMCHAYKDYTGKSKYCHYAVDSFRTLWQSINGPDSWDLNPWVWVVEFERV